MAYSYSTTYTDPYSKTAYEDALRAYNRSYGEYVTLRGDVKAAAQKASDIGDYYAPGGGYGLGQRAEAEKEIKAGLAKDIGTGIALGGSSMFAARGLNTLAGKELSTRYGNIADTAAANRLAALNLEVSPYIQMMNSLTSMINAKPVYGQYAQNVSEETRVSSEGGGGSGGGSGGGNKSAYLPETSNINSGEATRYTGAISEHGTSTFVPTYGQEWEVRGINGEVLKSGVYGY